MAANEISICELINMYIDRKMSIPEISEETGMSKSTVRLRLLNANVLRTKTDAIRLASKHNKLGSGNRGKTRNLSEQWKNNISIGMKKAADKTAAGVSLRPNGYIEYTRGEHKGKSVHVVAIEEFIGRRLLDNECVHHKDENRQNNDLSNLQLMTKSEHARHHALENSKNRKRNKDGQFE